MTVIVEPYVGLNDVSPAEAARSSVLVMEVSRTPAENFADTVLAELRVIIVAGITVGVLVAGFGSRLAMLVLRLTSSRFVRGVVSDDGFIIGRVTLGGTYNLLVLGAVVGVIGAGVYRLVGPRLIGPLWFRRLTVALACAAVVGSMLVHDDGIDFHLLTPQWLAIGLFVALPAAFGWAIGAAVDRSRRASPSGWRRWGVPIVLVVCFPPVVVALVPIAVVVVVLVAIDRTGGMDGLRSNRTYVFAVRSVWLVIAGAGLLALTNDIVALR